MTTCNADDGSAGCQPPSWSVRAVPLPRETAVEAVLVRLDIGSAGIEAAAELLSDEERQRAARFVVERKRRRFIVARSLLRQLLGSRLGIRPEAVELVYGKHGKPALAPRLAPPLAALAIHFNLAYSDDLAVLAFAAGRRVGVDIERLRALSTADRIVGQFFSPGEQQAYHALAPADRTLGFFNAWTRKEAFVKALGDGLCHPLDTFAVSLTPGQAVRIDRVGNIDGAACGWTLHGFRPAPGIVGAVVVEAAAAGSAQRSPARVH